MATKSIAWNDGSGDYITLTYTGQGNGTVAVTSQPNNSANARSATFDIRTAAGSPVVTRELTVTQGACPVPIGTVLNYAYTGSYQEVTLPAGQYKLQCWGAQGGSNAAASSYGITAKAGGKGGYSEGVITLSQKTTVRVYVGGQGSSSAGGYNGGGSTTGTSQYNASNEFGYSKMGGGGGATDIRLSDGALLSRMIVAGGGSGGAMCYKAVTTSSTTWKTVGTYSGRVRWNNTEQGSSSAFSDIEFGASVVQAMTSGTKYRVTGVSGTISSVGYRDSGGWHNISYSGGFTATSELISSPEPNVAHFITSYTYTYNSYVSYTLQKQVTSTTTSDYTDSQVGFAGGGTTGVGYSSTYQGKQNAAGSGGSFGQGANQTASNYRYCSGAGGGGWYGGGSSYSDSSMTNCKYSGGGSGFVNTAASAGNRPSGYTGLQLDSGTTYAGNQSFPNTAGTGNETGHAGNGYAKIARIAVLNITLRFKNEDNEPVVNTSVTLTSGSDTHTATTDANGEATFNVQNGTYSVSCVGYTLTPSQITVTKNQTFDFVAELPSVREYPYTGSVQQDTLPAGTYKIECWGAQGGYRSNASYGGKGGYSTGILNLTQTTTIYVYVGGSGNTGGTYGGFNGGGRRRSYVGGGGASDVRISQDSLYARVIVAGGGGSDGATSRGGGAGGGTNGQNTTASNYGTGGYGGGASASSPNTGGTSYFAGINATQPTSNSPTTQAETHNGFGWGGSGSYYSNGYGGAGGGGWFGGVGTYPDGSGDDDKGGGGGSGYVYTSETASNYPSGCLLDSSHYLSDAQTIAGNASMPSVDGGTETGHSGNGYIRITKLT